jgi:hypothetical protein
MTAYITTGLDMTAYITTGLDMTAFIITTHLTHGSFHNHHASQITAFINTTTHTR